jgi:hypothetical protein
MDYESLSIREAVQRINDTWYLPAIQRPYVWGERNKKEQFIYKLFDSLIRRYPVGTLIIWPTKKRIAYRDFLKEYDTEKLEKIKPETAWGNLNKCLIYDGQQRLQSLYSCLNYTFHDKVLCYDLLFDPDAKREPEGFKFFEKHKTLDPEYLSLNQLFSCNKKQQVEFEDQILRKFGKKPNKKDVDVIRRNLRKLWMLFVEDEIKLLASYSLKSDLAEKDVVDIFERINTTGMVLTNSEILFSRIKELKPDFEENVWENCREIKKITNGYTISPDEVLQIIFLLIKKGIRVDPDRVGDSELTEFTQVWGKLRLPLRSFFSDFIYKEFKINRNQIIRLTRPVIPLIVYFYYMRSVKGLKYKDFTQNSIMNMKKYFATSQLLDWDLDSYTDNFSKIIEKTIDDSKNPTPEFPYKQIRKFVSDGSKRNSDVVLSDFEDEDLRWFVLKILIPDKEFQYLEDAEERFNPEVDHIFPKKPKDTAKKYPHRYYEYVETIWNLQPVKGEVNNLKTNTPPQQFFEEHPEYLADYDFLPNQNPNNEIWLDKNIKDFIISRRMKMIRFAQKEYGIKVDL